MNLVICDTNIFIRLFAKDPEVIDELRKIGDANILMPSISVMELYAGMGNKAEMLRMQKQIKNYNVLHLDTATSHKAIELSIRFRLSHGLQIPDALIGAMSIVHDLPLYTYNQKDFKYMPGIQLYPLP